jgi:acid stress-induced BolA-like protein IbaG/YrbA
MEDEIAKRVAAAFPAAQVKISLDGNRALIEVISDVFIDMSRVARQQSVYACIEDYIADGRLHAVTIKAQPPGR